MTDRERELVNRYIYEVARRVPKAQREEIELELAELIDDMLEGLTLEQVFAKLGDPAVFAKKYREDKNYIISPEYYDNYMWVMKIVLICTAGGLFISAVVKCFIDYSDIFYIIVRFFNDIIIAGLTVFGAVTLIFASMERQKIKIDLKRDKAWSPDMLNPIPDKKARISRGDCIASIVFLILFSCLLIFAPQLFGAYAIDGNKVVNVPLFNLARWDIILPVFLFSVAVSFVDEIIKLVTGCYCRIVMFSSIITSAVGLISSAIVLKVLPIWNTDFARQVAQFDNDFKLKVFWQNKMVLGWDGQTLSNVVLAIIAFSCVIEVATTVYKTMRYGRDM